MTIYVDAVRTYPDAMLKDEHTRRNGREWSHMWGDEDIEELHRMALVIGLKRAWFQDHNPRVLHYDIVPSKRRLAVQYGAVEMSYHEYLKERRETNG